MAFYTALSLCPLLLAVVTIVGLAFGQEAARGEIVEQIHEVVGNEAAIVIKQLIARSSSIADGIWAGIVALATLLFGASGGVRRTLGGAEHDLEGAREETRRRLPVAGPRAASVVLAGVRDGVPAARLASRQRRAGRA